MTDDHRVAVRVVHSALSRRQQAQVLFPRDAANIEQDGFLFTFWIAVRREPGGAQRLATSLRAKERGIHATRPDAHALEAALAQHGSSRGRGTEGKRTLVMDETVIRPHGP